MALPRIPFRATEALKTERAALQAEVTALTRETGTLAEGLDRVRALLAREDRNWTAVFSGADGDEGLTLDDLKEWSDKIRNGVVGAPWLGRGLGLRSSYIWQGGIRYGKLGKQVKGYTQTTLNKRNFFGPMARRRREGCLYHDGIALWIGDNATKELHPIPLHEITGEFRDPNYHSDIWAYRRSWTETNPATGEKTPRVEWYFTDTFWDRKVSTIAQGTQAETVSQTHTAFDMHANSMEGYAYGSPDALAAQIWNGIARDLVMDGVTMSQALSTFALKATATGKTGGDRTTMRLASAKGAGQTAVVGGANDLVPLSSAGKGYDFESLRTIVAIVATALDVSAIALTSDPGAAGSSYGSASTLDLPTRLAMEARRQEHIELDARVLAWMGAPEAKIFFVSLNDAADLFREVQALLLLWSSGLYKPEPLEKRLSELMQIIGNTIPDAVLIPNNADSLERADIDPDSAGGDDVGKPNATPAGQGKNSPVGKAGAKNDLRKDGVAEMLKMLERFGFAYNEQSTNLAS